MCETIAENAFTAHTILQQCHHTGSTKSPQNYCGGKQCNAGLGSSATLSRMYPAHKLLGITLKLSEQLLPHMHTSTQVLQCIRVLFSFIEHQPLQGWLDFIVPSTEAGLVLADQSNSDNDPSICVTGWRHAKGRCCVHVWRSLR